MSTLDTVAADSSPDADSASGAAQQQATPPQPASEQLPTGDEPGSPSGPAQRHDEQQQPGQPSPTAEATRAAGRQAVQARSRRLPAWLERNGIAAAVITSFAALLVYGFMSLSNQIDTLGDRIDRVEDSLNQRIDRLEDNLNQRIDRVEGSLNQRITTEIAAVRDDMNQWIDRVNARFAQIDQRFAQIDQRFIQIEERLTQIEERLTDINTILFDHTGRLSRIETTLELGSNTTPGT